MSLIHFADMRFLPKYQFGPLPLPGLLGVTSLQATGMPALPLTGPRAQAPDPRCPDGGHWNETTQSCLPNENASGSDFVSAGVNAIDNELLRGGNMFALAGQAGIGMANAPGWKPDVGLGAAGGFLSGAASGGLLGGIFGAGAGFLQTAQNRTNYETLRDLYEKQKIRNKTVGANYGYYAQFGGQTPQAAPTQTELGEVVLFPDNALPNVLASKRHKHMDDDEITDMLPDGSYVFSDDKSMRFDARAVGKELLGVGLSHYDERGSHGGEKMFMSDVLPKRGKMTFAEAAKRIRGKIKTTGNRNDILDIATDSDNLDTRVPYLLKLVQMQDDKNVSEGRGASAQVPMIDKKQYGDEPFAQVPYGEPGSRAFTTAMSMLPEREVGVPHPELDQFLKSQNISGKTFKDRVINFQKEYGLSPDGIVGSGTIGVADFVADRGRYLDAIHAVESRGVGDYRALNPNTGAVGRYQFVPGARLRAENFPKHMKGRKGVIKQEELMKAVTGVKDMTEFRNSDEAQEQYMRYYSDNVLLPDAIKAKRVSKTKLPLSDVIALVHFQGYNNAVKLAKNPKGKVLNSKNNLTAEQYLEKYRKNLGDHVIKRRETGGWIIVE